MFGFETVTKSEIVTPLSPIVAKHLDRVALVCVDRGFVYQQNRNVVAHGIDAPAFATFQAFAVFPNRERPFAGWTNQHVQQVLRNHAQIVLHRLGFCSSVRRCKFDTASITVLFPMLDLSFVRNNLSAIEEMLRNRGMDPKAVLGDFPNVEAQRRQAIKSAETLKAERNRLSAKIPEMKKAGRDTTQLVSETKEMRSQIQDLEKAAEEYDARMTEVLAGIPNIPHASVPVVGTRCS